VSVEDEKVALNDSATQKLRRETQKNSGKPRSRLL
jgi:hypothetical protein